MDLVNLEELIKYHPYHICTFAKFADVTQDLLEATFKGEEELEPVEVRNISEYVQVPYRVLTCKKMIMLSKDRYRHRIIFEELYEKLFEIWEAAENGSKEAASYKRYNYKHLVTLVADFQYRGAVTYCRYLGVKEMMEQYLLFIRCEMRKPRGREIPT